MKNMTSRIACAAAGAALLLSGCTKSSDGDSGAVDLSPQARAAAAAAGFVPKEGADNGTLHVYTWCDYIAPEVLLGFERALGVKVAVDTFDSNESMYAKLKAGGTGYDIIMPTSYQIETMAKEGMVEVLDHAKIPNVRRNFDPSFAQQILDPSFRYNVPYAVTYAGFIYLKNRIPADANVHSWSVLGNAALRGRLSLLDDIREVIGAGLMYLGYSINSTSPVEIAEAAQQVLKWKANVRKFDGESYKTEVANGSTWLGHGYSTDITQVICGDEEAGMAPRPDIGFALPKEGFSIAFDEMVIAKDAARKDLAYAFINYLYDGDVARANMEFICGPSPVAPGIAQLDENYRKLIILDAETLVRGQVLRSFEMQPDVQALYNKAWDEIKATK